MGEDHRNVQKPSLPERFRVVRGGLSARMRMVMRIARHSIKCLSGRHPQIEDLDEIQVVEDCTIVVEYNDDGEVVKETYIHRKRIYLKLVTFALVASGILYYCCH